MFYNLKADLKIIYTFLERDIKLMNLIKWMKKYFCVKFTLNSFLKCSEGPQIIRIFLDDIIILTVTALF